MNDYMYLAAIIIGIVIAILLKWKDIKEIFKMHEEIKKTMQPI